MYLLASSRPNIGILYLRAISLACLVVALSYILFDVIDVDGSDLPRQVDPSRGAVLAADLEGNLERACLRNFIEVWGGPKVQPES